MKKQILFAITVAFCSVSSAQKDLFVFKKGTKTLALYTKGSYFAFQLGNDEWLSGYITKIQNDSFYLKPLAIQYSGMQADTLFTEIEGFALTDVSRIPKRGVQIDYINGQFQITMSGGHQHWYWVKNGWIFRTLAIGYAGLTVINGLIQNNLSYAGNQFGIAGGVFVLGEILKLTYKLTYRMGGKYHLEAI